MIPSAIACIQLPPSEDQIRAAKYFSELTGRDVPIICFNIPALEKQTEEAYQRNKQAYADTLDITLIPKVILNGFSLILVS